MSNRTEYDSFPDDERKYGGTTIEVATCFIKQGERCVSVYAFNGEESTETLLKLEKLDRLIAALQKAREELTK